MRRIAVAVLVVSEVIAVAGMIGRLAAQARALHGQGRDFLAQHLGSGPATDPGSRQFHGSVYETLGETAANPLLFGLAPAALLAGVENEVVGGISEKLGGRPFFSERGLDWQDLEANMQGMGRGLVRGLGGPGSGTWERGVADLRQRMAPAQALALRRR